MKTIRRHRTLFLAFIPVLILLYYNAVVNRHFHCTGHGWLITHAHPYQQIPESPGDKPGEDHSRMALIFLGQLDLGLLVFLSLFLFVVSLNNGRECEFFTQEQIPLLKQFYSFSIPRAPPFGL